VNQLAGIAATLVGSVTLMSAVGPSIGMATASGSFLINNYSVRGSAAVLDGMRVSTDRIPSYLNLDSGPQLSLGERSSGQVYKDRIVLERGSLQIDRASNFEVKTTLVRVVPSDPASKIRIAVDEQNRISVDVLAGAARVMNLRGLEIARVLPGSPLGFDVPTVPPQAGSASVVKALGCVHKLELDHKTYYLLYDSVAKVTLQLQGPAVEKLAGKHVELEGSLNTTVTPVKDAAEVMDVHKVVSEKQDRDKKGRVLGACGVSGEGRRVVPFVLGGVLVTWGVVGVGLASTGGAVSLGSAVGLVGPPTSVP
jgi:hypothetical protein